MDKDMRKLLKSLVKAGFEVKVTKKGHHAVYLEGRWVTTLSGTPSDHRSIKNGLAALKRAGFEKPP